MAIKRPKNTPQIRTASLHVPLTRGQRGLLELAAADRMMEVEDWARDVLLGVANVPRCRVCRCTDDNPCEGGCWWVADDLCSACEGADERVPAATRTKKARRR